MKINKIKTEKDAVCSLQDNVNQNSGELAQGNFICAVQLTPDEYSNIDFDTVRISPENEEINGVSDLDETLSNPKKQMNYSSNKSEKGKRRRYY